MRRRFVSLVLALAAVAIGAPLDTAAFAQEARTEKAAASVAGKWALDVKSPHGPVPMTLVLAQDGRKVTGTFTTPHGELRVSGEFADNTLKLATLDSEETTITLTGKLKENATLDGYLSSTMGDMTWKAERVKTK